MYLKETFLASLSDEQLGFFCAHEYDENLADMLQDEINVIQYQLFEKWKEHEKRIVAQNPVPSSSQLDFTDKISQLFEMFAERIEAKMEQKLKALEESYLEKLASIAQQIVQVTERQQQQSDKLVEVTERQQQHSDKLVEIQSSISDVKQKFDNSEQYLTKLEGSISQQFAYIKQKMEESEQKLTEKNDQLAEKVFDCIKNSIDWKILNEGVEVIGNNTLTTPTMTPTMNDQPTMTPTMNDQPTMTPTMNDQPTMTPTMNDQPTMTPTMNDQPTMTPTMNDQPTMTPTMNDQPTMTPTMNDQPTMTPTMNDQPTMTPTMNDQPTMTPTMNDQPTMTPTMNDQPTMTPTMNAIEWFEEIKEELISKRYECITENTVKKVIGIMKKFKNNLYIVERGTNILERMTRCSDKTVHYIINNTGAIEYLMELFKNSNHLSHGLFYILFRIAECKETQKELLKSEYLSLIFERLSTEQDPIQVLYCSLIFASLLDFSEDSFPVNLTKNMIESNIIKQMSLLSTYCLFSYIFPKDYSWYLDRIINGTKAQKYVCAHVFATYYSYSKKLIEDIGAIPVLERVASDANSDSFVKAMVNEALWTVNRFKFYQ